MARRVISATQDVCRFRSEADMSRLVRPGQSVENDPQLTSQRACLGGRELGSKTQHVDDFL
jgi:hypothetical protein